VAGNLRALWKGVIEADNLSVPVKLYTAVRPHEIHFKMLHDQDHTPVRQVLECPQENKEVPREHAVRGFEVRKDQYVLINEEDLDGCGPEASRSIRVLHFVDPSKVDPIYFEKAQYLGPDEHAERSYATFVEALKQTDRAAIVQYVLRGKQYLAMVRPLADALCLEQMRYADEVLPAEELGGLAEEVEAPVGRRGSARASGAKKSKAAGGGGAISEREVSMAEQLVDALASTFDPTQYRDEYEECVMDMIQRKAGGEVIATRVPKEKPATKGKDLTDALRASLEHVRRTRDAEDPSRN
jgi:DNA end-binding protein Ku